MDVVIKWVIFSEGMINGGHACDYTVHALMSVFV